MNETKNVNKIVLPKWLLFLIVALALFYAAVQIAPALMAPTQTATTPTINPQPPTNPSGAIAPTPVPGGGPPTPTPTAEKEKTSALKYFSASGAITKVEYRTQNENQEREIGKALVNVYNGAYIAEILIDKKQIESINLKIKEVEFNNFKMDEASVGNRLLTANIKGSYKMASLRIEAYKDLPNLKASDAGGRMNPGLLGITNYEYISHDLPNGQIKAIVSEWAKAKYLILEITVK